MEAMIMQGLPEGWEWRPYGKHDGHGLYLYAPGATGIDYQGAAYADGSVTVYATQDSGAPIVERDRDMPKSPERLAAAQREAEQALRSAGVFATVEPTKPRGCGCIELDASTCTGPRATRSHPLYGSEPCPCACHGGPDIAAPSPLDGVVAEVLSCALPPLRATTAGDYLQEISDIFHLDQERIDATTPREWLTRIARVALAGLAAAPKEPS